MYCIKMSGEAASADIETTRALESQCQSLSNEELCDLAQLLTGRQKEDGD
jgi:hypothetical protein